MSWGVGLRTGVAVGVGNIVAFFAKNKAAPPAVGHLLTESGANLTQEDGSLILV